jgi:hypothetical protein
VTDALAEVPLECVWCGEEYYESEGHGCDADAGGSGAEN